MEKKLTITLGLPEAGIYFLQYKIRLWSSKLVGLALAKWRQKVFNDSITNIPQRILPGEAT